MKKAVFLLALLLLCPLMSCGKLTLFNENPENNLRQLAMACRMYANESPGQFFPPLDATVGRLMCAANTIYPEYLNSKDFSFVSPRHPQMKALRERGEVPDDVSYVYLGYAVCVPQNVALFVDMYNDFAAGRFVPGQDYVRPGTGQTLKQLRESAVIYCSGAPGPDGGAAAAAAMPLFLERRDYYKGKKAPVAFFDGHIEWLAPGQNELVDKIYEALPKLDSMARQ